MFWYELFSVQRELPTLRQPSASQSARPANSTRARLWVVIPPCFWGAHRVMPMEVDSLERACPDCGALVAFFEWPGNEACPSCGRVLYVNSTGQIGHAPVDEFPNP